MSSYVKCDRNKLRESSFSIAALTFGLGVKFLLLLQVTKNPAVEKIKEVGIGPGPCFLLRGNSYCFYCFLSR